MACLLLASLTVACEESSQDSLLCVLDDNGDGTMLLTCDNGFDHVMTNGRDGVDGQAALLRLTAEPAGANCEDGGVRVEQTVDGQPVGQPQYLCAFGTSAELGPLEARVADLEADNAELQTALDAFVTEEDLADFLTEDDLTDFATRSELADAVTSVQVVDDRVTALEPIAEDAVRLIREDTILNVPADFATIDEALDWVDGYAIARNVSVDIQLADGVYNFTAPLQFGHPNGRRMRLIGHPGEASQVVLSFTNSPGLQLGRLGSVEGVTIRGDGSGFHNGVQSSRNGYVRLAPDVVVENFSRTCVRAIFAGVVEADGVTVRGCSEDGFAAVFSGVVSAPGALSSENGRYGFLASTNGAVFASNARAELNGNHGFQSVFGSGVFADFATADENGNIGFHAFGGSGLRAEGATATNNAWSGFGASVGSGLSVDRSLAQDNGGDGFSAWMGSATRADDAVSSGNGGDGFGAYQASSVSAFEGEATDNTFNGYTAWASASMDAPDSSSTGNAGAGYWTFGSSFLWAPGIVASENEGVAVSAGASSAMLVMDSNVSDNLGEGVQTFGYSYTELRDSVVSNNLGLFGVNVFWGAWINAENVVSTGHTYDYNIGPHSDVFDLDWGVIYQPQIPE